MYLVKTDLPACPCGANNYSGTVFPDEDQVVFQCEACKACFKPVVTVVLGSYAQEMVERAVN